MSRAKAPSASWVERDLIRSRFGAKSATYQIRADRVRAKEPCSRLESTNKQDPISRLSVEQLPEEAEGSRSSAHFLPLPAITLCLPAGQHWTCLLPQWRDRLRQITPAPLGRARTNAGEHASLIHRPCFVQR